MLHVVFCWVLCRVKELTKEAAKRSNSSLSTASHTAANVPHSSETAPDIVPRNASKQPSRKPSLFHPSNIQLSSTPMKDGKVRTLADVDFNSLLLDGENDLPISGHHLSSGSSTNYDRQLYRISLIPDQSQNTVNTDGKSETDLKSSLNEAENIQKGQTRNIVGKSEPDVSNHKQSLIPQDGKKTGAGETECERLRNEPTSPCSCRSLNCSYVGDRLECDCSFTGRSRKLITQLPSVQNLPSPHRLVSSGTDSRQLFAETKARMASARTNISDFLQSEKSRTADSSLSSKPAPISRETGRVLGINGHVITASQSHEDWSVGGSTEKLPLTVLSGNAVTNFDGVTCPPADAVSMETASETASLSGQNMLNDNGRQRAEMSGRSWAEILEQSSQSYGNRSGAHVTSAPLPDLSCSGDDVVTPEMLESLKTRIKELKHRQDQLERDQLLSTQDCPPASTTKPSSNTSTGASVTKLGSQPVSTLGADFSYSGVPVSNREDEVAASQNADAHLQYGPPRTSAARSLKFEFTNPPASLKSSKLLAFSTTNVVSPASDSGISSNTHTGAFISAVDGCGRFLLNSQTPVTSSGSDCVHVMDSYMPAADAGSYAVQRLVTETMATTTNSSEQPLAVPLNSSHGKPQDGLQTCITNSSLDLAPNPNTRSSNPDTRSVQPVSVNSNNETTPNTGSANPNTGLSSMQPVSVILNNVSTPNTGSANLNVGLGLSFMQPVSVISNNDAGGQVHHFVANTVTVSCSNAGVISTATLAGPNDLSLDSGENLDGSSQFAVQNTTTEGGTAAAPVLVGRHLSGFDPNSITFAQNNVLNPTPVSCAVSSQLPDRQNADTSMANAGGKAASFLQQAAFIPSQTLPSGENPEDCNDVKNFPHISNGKLDLPGLAHGSDMIQQSTEDKARQHLQSV